MGIRIGSNITSKTIADINNRISGKENSVEGKGLSTNDYDNAAKQSVALIPNKVDKGTATTPLIWRAPVATTADLITTYPGALKDWAALVEADGFIYAFDGVNWNNTGLKNFPEDVVTSDKLSKEVEPIYNEIIENHNSTTNVRIEYPSGVETPDNTYRLVKIACSPTDKIYCTCYVSSIQTCGIGLYNALGEKLALFFQGTGSGVWHEDFIVPLKNYPDVAEIKVAGNYLNLPVIKKVTGRDVKVYSKTETNSIFPKKNAGEIITQKWFFEKEPEIPLATENHSAVPKRQLDTAVAPFYKDILTEQILSRSNHYVKYNTGVEMPSPEYRMIKMACTVNDRLFITAYVRSVDMAGVGFFKSDGTLINTYLLGTGNEAFYIDLEIGIPNETAEIKVSGNYLYPPKIKKVTGSQRGVYTDSETDKKFMKVESGEVIKKYGIRWNLTDNNSYCERTYDATGLTASKIIGTDVNPIINDFDNIYPWSHIRRCNLTTLPSGAKKIIYKGENGYLTDGSNGDVMLEIPMFGYERQIKNGYEYRTISRTGMNPHPAFVDNGKILDKIYIGAYEGSKIDNKLMSISGVLPLENETAQYMLNLAKSKGSGYSLKGFWENDLLQNLMWIEHGNRNSNYIIGHGWSHLHQPVETSYISILTENQTNRFVVQQVISNNDRERFFANSQILICENLQTNILYRKKIIDLQINIPVEGQHTFVLDGDPIDTRVGMFLGSGPQLTGLVDEMQYHTGRLDRARVVPSSTIPRDTINSCQYREIENPVGNVWEFMPDVTFLDRVPYLSQNIQDHEFGKIMESYKPVAIEVPLQDINNEGLWITQLGKDNYLDKIAFCKEFGTPDSSEFNYFGAYHYLNNGLAIGVHGGGFDHHVRTNILTMRFWANLETKWYLYGCRLIYKPI